MTRGASSSTANAHPSKESRSPSEQKASASCARCGLHAARDAKRWLRHWQWRCLIGLKTIGPLFPVPEERIEEFRSLLNNWRFGSYRKVHGLYRPEKHEYVFNGDPSHTASSEYIAQRASQMRGVEGCDLFELRA